MEKIIEFKLEEFTGPLDLLLSLISKNKMSIYDIEIMTLIDQYLDVVGTPERATGLFAPGEDGAPTDESALDTMSEFITMAAHLVQMKSRLLLPRSEEGERMREELTGLLVEYSACKAVASQLREMAEGVFIAVRAPASVELDTEYKYPHQPAELAAALDKIGGRHRRRRPPRREQFDEIVAAPFVSVNGKAIRLIQQLKKGTVLKLRQIFSHEHSRSETVATFLALLELIRHGRISLDEEEVLHLDMTRRRDRLKAAMKD